MMKNNKLVGEVSYISVSIAVAVRCSKAIQSLSNLAMITRLYCGVAVVFEANQWQMCLRLWPVIVNVSFRQSGLISKMVDRGGEVYNVISLCQINSPVKASHHRIALMIITLHLCVAEKWQNKRPVKKRAAWFHLGGLV